MLIYKNKKWLSWLFPTVLWSKERGEKVIYLTFDDGPIPEITDFVLSTLSSYAAKATFFLVGDNVRKYPQILRKVVSLGHSVGNHTFNHLVGWKVSNQTYFDNVDKFDDIMASEGLKTNLFRPPHGKMKIRQFFQLHKKKKIVMWDVLTRDYASDLDEKECLRRAIKNTESGSIVVFHDSLKAKKNLSYVLPRYLDYFKSKGYVFKALPYS